MLIPRREQLVIMDSKLTKTKKYGIINAHKGAEKIEREEIRMDRAKWLFRGQTRRYGEKIKNFAGEKMESAWAIGPGVARGNGGYSIIYGTEKGSDAERVFADKHTVYTDTLGLSSGKVDRNGILIFTGDIVQHLDTVYEEYDCQSVVHFGEFDQDGSGDEYNPSKCLGFYVEVNNYTCPDWDEDNSCFPQYKKQQSLLEVCERCEVIGNVFDNPELIKGRE